MKVTESETLAYFDIDSTLIRREKSENILTKKLQYYNHSWNVIPLYKNIEFLKSLKSRGYYIIVHSANGWEHAKNVVELLELQKYVDEVKSKPLKYCDDEPVENWFGPRIFLENVE